MGSFYANLQVRAEHLDAVQAALHTRLTGQGYTVCPPEEGDRTVHLVMGEGWVSVYDSEVDQGDTQGLARQAIELSRALGSPAFTVMVHDSDVLLLDLYAAGACLDRFNSWPGYFEGKSPKVEPGPHIRAWNQLFPGQQGHLEAVFSAEGVFAEAALEPLSRVVGIPTARLGTGARYLAHDGTLEGVVSLAYRLAQRPAWAVTPEGPPRLLTPWEIAELTHGNVMPDDAIQVVEAAVGAQLDLHLSARSVGAGSTGLEVRLRGDADGVDWTGVRVVLGHPRDQVVVEAPLVATGVGWAASLPQVRLPDGVPMHIQPTSPADMMKVMEAQFAAGVHVTALGTGRLEGEGTVRLAAWPTGHPGQGTSIEQPYAVVSTNGRPLRAPDTVHPTMLAPLRTPTQVVGILCVSPDGVADRLARVVEVVKPVLPTSGTATTTVFPAAKQGLLGMLTGRPKTRSGKAGSFLSGKRLGKLIDALADGANLVEVTWSTSKRATDSTAELRVGRGLAVLPGQQAAVVVGLPASDEAEALLAAAFDAECVSGGVFQGLVTRWETPGSTDTTPYELACGVHGQCTLMVSWLQRWVRGVGLGTLWLGPELVGHLPEPPAGVMVGGLLRVQVTDVAAMEDTLAEVLPDARAWQAGMQTAYSGTE